MSKFIVAALAAGAVLASGGAVIAQQSPQKAAAGEAAKDGQNLPPVVVQQKKPAGDAAVKPAAKKPVADDGPQPKQRKKVVSKPKPAPDAAPAPAPETSGSAAQAAGSPATALGTYNPALDLPGLKLPPGTTLTTAGPVQGYRALSAMSSTKTATPIEQIPQSIQVVPRSVIEDQRNLTVTEALQNVSNVQGPNTRSLGDVGLYPIKIRGFGAEQWLDGLSLPFNTGDRDAMANVERIEVLKGPSAILYGGGAGAPIGGAVNIVSKLPTDKASGELGVTFGSNSYARPYFDINQPLSANGTVLFRVTGEYTSADSFIDVLNSDRYSFNPTLTLTDKTNTTLTVQGRISSAKQQTYQGLPVVGTVAGNFRIDRDLFIGPSDIPRGYSDVHGITVTLDHRFDSVWSANVKARWSQSVSEQNTQILAEGGVPSIPPSTWMLANSQLHHEQDELTINPNLQARFSLGATRNTLLVGGDYSRVKDKGFLKADYLGNAGAVFFAGCGGFCPAVTTVDLQNPIFNTPYTAPGAQYVDLLGIPQVVNYGTYDSVYTTKGVYTQLQSTIFDRVHFLGGLRLGNVVIDYSNVDDFLGQTTSSTDKTKLLPRVGVVVDLLPGLSAFASYSEGLKGVPVAYVGTPKPEESEQSEAGLKININDQLAGTVAVYEIDRQNVPVFLGLGYGGLARQKSRGFEADAIWQPTRNWQMLASYGYTDAWFADSLQSVPEGNKFAGVPEHSGRFWVNYSFDQPLLRGWSVGAGVYAASSQFVDSANLYKTSAYYTVDAKIGYETEHYKAAFVVKNVTGNEYFVPYAFLGGQVAPSDDRTFYGTLAYKY